MSSTTRMYLSLGLLAMTLTACAGQPAAPPPAEAPELASPPVYFESDLVGLVPEAEKPLVLEIEPEGQAPVTVRYARGVEEEVRWEGAGDGVVELHNEHGQLIYRVSEGGEPFTGLIPAGRYTLTVWSGAAEARTFVSEPEVAASGIRRDLSWLDQGAPRRGGDAPWYSYVNLTAEDLRGKNLRGATFQGVTFYDVSFKDHDLRDTTFIQSRLERCHFDQSVQFFLTTFITTQIRESVFHSTDMRNVTLDSTMFVDNHVIGGTWWGVNLWAAWLSGNRFEGTDLVYVHHDRYTRFGDEQSLLKPFGDNQGFSSDHTGPLPFSRRR